MCAPLRALHEHLFFTLSKPKLKLFLLYTFRIPNTITHYGEKLLLFTLLEKKREMWTYVQSLSLSLFFSLYSIFCIWNVECSEGTKAHRTYFLCSCCPVNKIHTLTVCCYSSGDIRYGIFFAIYFSYVVYVLNFLLFFNFSFFALLLHHSQCILLVFPSPYSI